MKDIKAWLTQPTTVAGMSTLSGTFIAVLLHQISLAAAAPLLAGAAMSIILPDNSAAKQEAQDLAKEVVNRSAGKVAEVQ